MLQSLVQLHDISSIDIENFHIPTLPRPPNSFRGIRMKNLSLKRWLTICSDDSVKCVISSLQFLAISLSSCCYINSVFLDIF